MNGSPEARLSVCKFVVCILKLCACIYTYMHKPMYKRPCLTIVVFQIKNSLALKSHCTCGLLLYASLILV